MIDPRGEEVFGDSGGGGRNMLLAFLGEEFTLRERLAVEEDGECCFCGLPALPGRSLVVLTGRVGEPVPELAIEPCLTRDSFRELAAGELCPILGDGGISSSLSAGLRRIVLRL